MSKLVRDEIPKIIEQKGQQPVGYIADEMEYQKRLLDKLFEEIEEFKEAHSMEELADVLEVIDAIYDGFHFSKEEVNQVKEKKKQERGGFASRYILEKIENAPSLSGEKN